MNNKAEIHLRLFTVLVLCVASLTIAGCDDYVGPDVEASSTGGYQREADRLKSATEENIVLQWNATLLEAIRTSSIGPPQTARALALVHTSMYNAWAAYDAVALPTRGDVMRRPTDEHTEENKTEAISYAAYHVLADLFPGRMNVFDALLQHLAFDPAVASVDPRTPAGVGISAATEILAFAHQDGSNQLGGYADYTGYQPYNTADVVYDAERWQPLRNPDGSIQIFVAPHWQNVTPFALASAAQYRPRPPAPYKSGAYQRQVQEVILNSAKLTDREKAIVEYWADGPASELPPGHWNLFARFVSRRESHTLDEDVKMFFALNNALCDASIAAWDAKRAYDYVRPITAIRHLKRGKKIRSWAGPYRGIQVVDGGDWLPYQVPSFLTPPFSEYVSGHSTFSSAAAEILRRVTGSDRFDHSARIPAGSSRVEPGTVPARDVVLSWKTFSDAADEAGMSRRYGGIHFEQGDLEGRTLGRKVGAAVWEKAQAYINGLL